MHEGALCPGGRTVFSDRRDCIPSPTPSDAVTHPPHYTQHPSGVECITITQHYNFNLGNAIKYVWRAGLKSKNPVEDLKKARQYIDFELTRLASKVTP